MYLVSAVYNFTVLRLYLFMLAQIGDTVLLHIFNKKYCFKKMSKHIKKSKSNIGKLYTTGIEFWFYINY